jgi:hypothetical protein
MAAQEGRREPLRRQEASLDWTRLMMSVATKRAVKTASATTGLSAKVLRVEARRRPGTTVPAHRFFPLAQREGPM